MKMFIYLYSYFNRDNTINIVPNKDRKNALHIEIIAEANLHLMYLERLFYKIYTNLNNQNNYNKITIYT